MSEIVVLSCTNRLDSNTLKVSKIYQKILSDFNIEAPILDFCKLPETIAFSETFGARSESYSSLIERFISSRQRFIFVLPEYNGSFPGILKVFLDSVPPREWHNKRACLVGVAEGRAGNLRGMEHLTGILHYLKMHVYYDKLPLSGITKMFLNGEQFLEPQQSASKSQIEGFLKF